MMPSELERSKFLTPGAGAVTVVDVDSLLRLVYGKKKQGTGSGRVYLCDILTSRFHATYARRDFARSCGFSRFWQVHPGVQPRGTSMTETPRCPIIDIAKLN